MNPVINQTRHSPLKLVLIGLILLAGVLGVFSVVGTESKAGFYDYPLYRARGATAYYSTSYSFHPDPGTSNYWF